MLSRTYSTNIEALLRERRLMPLDAGTPDESVAEQLDGALLERVFGKEIITNRTSARLCVAGLWLLFNHLEESHEIAQSIETADGSYWHAIMHRREGDFSNSKYWFRRAGEHKIFSELANESKQHIMQNISLQVLSKEDQWDPVAFVDLCEKAVRQDRPMEEPCRQIQQIEWQLLFGHCYRKAIE